MPLVAELWPLLERAAAVVAAAHPPGGGRALGEDDPRRAVLGQLFQVQRHLVVGLSALVRPRLPALLGMAARLYGGCLHEGALETAGAAVEIFSSSSRRGQQGQQQGQGQGEEEEENGCFAALLAATGGPTFAHLRSGVGAQECPQLVAGFFGMLLRYLEFRPAGAWSSV